MILSNVLKEIKEIELLVNTNIGQYTTTKLQCSGDLIIIKTINALLKVLELLNKYNLSFHIIGMGSNQIIKTEKKIHLKLKFENFESILESEKQNYVLPSSLPLNLLTAHAMKFNLKGWDCFTGVPASLGGAVFMNAGTSLGEISKILDWVELVDSNGNIRIFKVDSNSFSYRKNHFIQENEIITTVCLKNIGHEENLKNKIREYLDFRKKTQPLSTQNCGCVFKNYSDEFKAGKCIDELGLKGYQLGNVRVSPVHGNFFENMGNATPEEYLKLMKYVQDKLFEKYGILFEFEVKVY
jgi:UDP-N-acetylmuramate dehydrogenase